MDTVDKINTIAATLPVIATRAGVNSCLPNLWVETSEFEKVNGILAFRFYIDDANDLTVHGWEQPYNNNRPAIYMKTSTDSEVELTNTVYLGNLYISAVLTARIKQMIRDGDYVAVVFEPVIDTASQGQLTYKVILSRTLPALRVNTQTDSLRSLSISSAVQQQSGQTTDAGILLNPSPPRDI